LRAIRKPKRSGFYARRAPIATPTFREGRGVLVVELLAQIRAPLLFADWRVQLFRLCVAFFALRDRAAAVRDALPSRADLRASTVLAYGAVGVMAAILADDLLTPAAAISPPRQPEPRPEWIEIARPYPAFALESPMLAGLDSKLLVRVHRIDGGRKEEFTFGDPAAAGGYARISLYRPGPDGMAGHDPFEAVVAVAAESAIDADLQETDRKLGTKFGALPVIAMSVKRREETRRCLATAHAWTDPRLGLVAWWCNEGEELVAHGEFACLLDRLALMSAGGDDRLAEFFARVELRRGACGSHGTFMTATPPRPGDWLHAKNSPRLRGRITGR
jgi:hypothetical protein